jgi:HSP20 family protein
MGEEMTMTESDVRHQLRKHLTDLADSLESAVRGVPGVSGLVGCKLPPVNVYEAADAVIVRAEVPGVSRENLDIRLAAGRLCIRCRPDAGQFETYTCLARERDLVEYSREIPLPVAVDQDAETAAVLADGVLTVRLKKLAVHQGKPIEVEVR